MVAWHHQLNGHEFERTQGDGEGQVREAWSATVHGVAKSQTRLSNRTTKTIKPRKGNIVSNHLLGCTSGAS